MAETSIISVTGWLARVMQNSSAFDAYVVEFSKSAAAAYGRGIIAEKTPVDTGRAQAAWYLDRSVIKNDVPYVSFLEEGTYKMQPYGMIAKSEDAIVAKFYEVARSQIRSF
jgi:hypothetical protein